MIHWDLSNELEFSTDYNCSGEASLAFEASSYITFVSCLFIRCKRNFDWFERSLILSSFLKVVEFVWWHRGPGVGIGSRTGQHEHWKVDTVWTRTPWWPLLSPHQAPARKCWSLCFSCHLEFVSCHTCKSSYAYTVPLYAVLIFCSKLLIISYTVGLC